MYTSYNNIIIIISLNYEQSYQHRLFNSSFFLNEFQWEQLPQQNLHFYVNPFQPH